MLFRSVLREQGARCMDCGIPFCHTGKLINGAASGCPINNLIPEWNDLVYRGQWEEASIRLARTNDFPEFTGRVCPAPCEGSCTVGISAPAVTIKQIEVEIAEHAWEHGLIRPEPPITRTGVRRSCATSLDTWRRLSMSCVMRSSIALTEIGRAHV